MDPARDFYRQKANWLRSEGLRLYAEKRPHLGWPLIRGAMKWERTARRVEWLYSQAKRETEAA